MQRPVGIFLPLLAFVLSKTPHGSMKIILLNFLGFRLT